MLRRVLSRLGEVAQKLYCSNCGHGNPPGTVYCQACGKMLNP